MVKNNNSLFKSFGIGFGNTLDILNDLEQYSDQYKYPPHNIIETEREFIIELACAGFSKEELKVFVDDKSVVIKGKKFKKESDSKVLYQYNGIAVREFNKQFVKDYYSRVDKVSYQDGILKIVLVKVFPEDKKLLEISID
jgi:molecular chaperone IbpA